jgi:hypothetical protein
LAPARLPIGPTQQKVRAYMSDTAQLTQITADAHNELPGWALAWAGTH